MTKIKKIISGGQTGVDQAALKAGLESGLAVGGWCPPGRICESGQIPLEYPLTETEKERSDKAPDVPRSQRTEFNVSDSDATLILMPQSSVNDKGSECTVVFARKCDKPFIIVDPEISNATDVIADWLEKTPIETLNIAGPSEKTFPGIHDRVYHLLLDVFKK